MHSNTHSVFSYKILTTVHGVTNRTGVPRNRKETVLTVHVVQQFICIHVLAFVHKHKSLSYPILAACTASTDVSWSARRWRAACGGRWPPPGARNSCRLQNTPWPLWRICTSELSVEENVWDGWVPTIRSITDSQWSADMWIEGHLVEIPKSWSRSSIRGRPWAGWNTWCTGWFP